MIVTDSVFILTIGRTGMLKRKWAAILALVVLVVGVSYALGIAQGVVRRLYVAVNQENLRDTPRGKVIAKLNKGTEMVVLAETDKWVKVQVTGWIWKESTTPVRPKNLAGAMRAYHIMVKTREQAEEILKQLKAGADFQELARKYSIGPTAQQGGDLGYFYPGDFAPEFDQAIRKLKPGEISGIVKTAEGYHIFKRVK